MEPQWTEFFSSLAREETAAWIFLGFGVFFLGIAIKGLWTGSIWVPFTPPGFDGWLWWSRTESDQRDRDTDAFNFWLTLVLVGGVGILAIFQSFRMFGFW